MIYFFDKIEDLCGHLTGVTGPYTDLFILCDENTHKHCLPLIRKDLPAHHLIAISSGEKNKNLKTCEYIWDALTEKMADRKALLINLGGGVITDMGGFAASCYKRGIDFVHIPTTLLAMTDASVGGKTGIDHHNFKNQIGLFSEAQEVLICNEFLKTLDARQIRSGLAEVVKHYLIADGPAFIDLSRTGAADMDIRLIQKAVGIKSQIVAQDPLEGNVRKKLNFGHTIGHALESYSLTSDEPLLHGEAVAYGMAIETYIAAFMSLIDEEKAGFICHTLWSVFALKPLPANITGEIPALALQDKKNENGAVKMSLIDDIGSCKTDIEVSSSRIREAIDYFNKSVSLHAK